MVSTCKKKQNYNYLVLHHCGTFSSSACQYFLRRMTVVIHGKCIYSPSYFKCSPSSPSQAPIFCFPLRLLFRQTTVLASCWPASSAGSTTCASCCPARATGRPSAFSRPTTTLPRPPSLCVATATITTVAATATASLTAACSTPATTPGSAWSWPWRSQRCATTEVEGDSCLPMQTQCRCNHRGKHDLLYQREDIIMH